MKIRIAWILLAIYLNASARTLFPFVQDCVAHMFYWQDHLEHVHHGQVHSHHLHDELLAADPSADDKNLPASQASFFNDKVLSTHLPLCFSQEPVSIVYFDLPDISWTFIWRDLFKKVITPPPRLG